MNVEAIKIDLTTSGLTQKQIAEKHGVGQTTVCFINTGVIHADVKPLTPKQINKKRPMNFKQRARAEVLDITFKNKDELNFFFDEISKNDTWPKSISFNPKTPEQHEWVIHFLERRKRQIEIKLSKLRLMIDAIERNDYSDLPPSCVKELESNISEILPERAKDQQELKLAASNEGCDTTYYGHDL